MQSYKTDYLLRDENAVFEVAVLSALGDREEQQDSAGIQLKTDEGLVVVCDGMGGHAGGQTASTLATEVFLNSYLSEYPCGDIRSWLIDTVNDADSRVAKLQTAEGTPMNAGSTAASVFIRGDNLFWLSVGDSRIYLFRNGELVRATADHNYATLLQHQLDTGEIDDAAYQEKIGQGEALVSFLGMNGIPYMDANDVPFALQCGDKILLTTDGLYKLISDEGIKNILTNFENAEDALTALEMKARKIGKTTVRDNMTVALIKVK